MLFRRFHTFRNDAKLEAFTHVDDGADEGGIVRVSGHLVDERLVDLQGMNGELPQITQTGITRAEVINGKLYAQACKCMQHGIGNLDVSHENTFSQFQFQIGRLQSRLL